MVTPSFCLSIIFFRDVNFDPFICKWINLGCSLLITGKNIKENKKPKKNYVATKKMGQIGRMSGAFNCVDNVITFLNNIVLAGQTTL